MTKPANVIKLAALIRTQMPKTAQKELTAYYYVDPKDSEHGELSGECEVQITGTSDDGLFAARFASEDATETMLEPVIVIRGISE